MIILTNFIYAFFAIILTLVSVYVATKFLDKMTDFDTSKEIEKGNLGAAIVFGSLLIAIAIAISNVVGMSLN